MGVCLDQGFFTGSEMSLAPSTVRTINDQYVSFLLFFWFYGGICQSVSQCSIQMKFCFVLAKYSDSHSEQALVREKLAQSRFGRRKDLISNVY